MKGANTVEKETVFQTMYRSGVVPVVSVSDPRKAVGLAKAIARGGVHVLEIAFRTEGAAECVRAVRRECPEMTVGAGTILTREQLLLAKQVGAMFAVAPGYDEDIVALSQKEGMPFIPGTINSTDIQKGLKAGLNVIKFFPAEPHGGLRTIGYLTPPFPTVRFLPAGGIGFDNLEAYLSNPAILACAGGFMARSTHIEQEDWDTVTALCGRIAEIAAKRLPRDN